MAVPQVENGVIRDDKVTFRKVRRPCIRCRGHRRVILRDFHNFSVVELPLVKSIDGLSVIGLQRFHGILAQQFENLEWQVGGVGGLEGLPGEDEDA